MFMDEEVCNGFLSKIGSSKTAIELRFFLGGAMFGGTGAVGYESSWNRFHDYDDVVLGGLEAIGTSSSGGFGGGFGDDGYDSGEGGGGDCAGGE